MTVPSSSASLMGYGMISILGCMNNLITFLSAAISCPPYAAKKLLISLLWTSYPKGLSLGQLTNLLLKSIALAQKCVVNKKVYHQERLIISQAVAPHHKAGHSSINELVDKDEFSLFCVKIDDAIRSEGPWDQVV